MVVLSYQNACDSQNPPESQFCFGLWLITALAIRAMHEIPEANSIFLGAQLEIYAVHKCQ